MHTSILVELKKAVFLAFVLVLLSIVVVVRFIRPVEASRTIHIREDGSIEPLTANITTADNVTYYFTDNNYDEVVVEKDNIVVDGLGYTVQGSGSGAGMNLTGRSNVTIVNAKIKNFRYGIFLNYFSSLNTLVGNNITNNSDGIYLSYASNNTISGNTITNNTDSIALEISSNYNALVGNNITDNYNGILVKFSDNNNISGNAITNNWYGIHLSGTSDYNNIFGNNITANGYCGIFLDDFSSLNTIVGNNITNNYNGIYLGESTNNHIYHNNFRSNTQQVYTCNLTNVWDDGAGKGNYWSDYEERYPNATEIDGSGIWNTPYVIDENNQDNYPLMDDGGKFEPYVSTFHLLFKDESHNLLGNLSAELRITEAEKEIIRSVCKLSLSSPRPDEYHKPYIDKIELFTGWTFIIHPWGPDDIPYPPPATQEVTLHVDEEIILFERTHNVSGFVEEPRLIFWFSHGTKIWNHEWDPLILPTIRVYFSDGQE
jgi:parallel beta-helix repeat protein